MQAYDEHERFVFKNISQKKVYIELPENTDICTEIFPGEYFSVCVDEKFTWTIQLLRNNNIKFIEKITVNNMDLAMKKRFYIGNEPRQACRWK